MRSDHRELGGISGVVVDMNTHQLITESARERAKERLVRLLTRIQSDKREAKKLADELGYPMPVNRNRNIETYCLIDAI